MLIAGSGPQSRDENVSGHKIFLVLADALNQRGIAVLRYDKRGAGRSTGDFTAATLADLASDARAAVTYLRTRADVDRDRIGLVGHSEGGYIAPWVAADDPAIAFVVLMAAPGLAGTEVVLRQREASARARGEAPSQIALESARTRRMFDAILASPDPDAARRRIDAVVAADGSAHVPPGVPDPRLEYTSPQMFSFLRYDPAPALARVRAPVLAMGGSLDQQIPAREHLEALRMGLKGAKEVTVVEAPGLNHMFQTAATGSPAEFARIEQTVAPAALKTMGDWVVAHSRPSDRR